MAGLEQMQLDQLRVLVAEQHREIEHTRRQSAASRSLAVAAACRTSALWRAWAQWIEASSTLELEALTLQLAQRETLLRRLQQDAAATRNAFHEQVTRLEADLEACRSQLKSTERVDDASKQALALANAKLDERLREVAGARVRRLGSLLTAFASNGQARALGQWRVACTRLPSSEDRWSDHRPSSFVSPSRTTAPLDRAALEASHAQLSTRARLLQRRIDGLVTEKERLQAQANERDRELRHEATALRAALLAAGGAARGKGRISTSPGESEISTAEAEEAEATLERAALRRKAADLSADNALLTQNFMMLKNRMADVVATREAELQELSRDRDIREASLRREALSTSRVLEAVLRSSLREAEGAHAAQRLWGATRRLLAVLLADRATKLHGALMRWYHAMFVGEQLTCQRLESQRAKLEERALVLMGRALARLPDLLAHASVPLAAALDRWRAAVLAHALDASRASRAELEVDMRSLSSLLASATDGSETAQQQAKERIADLERDLSEASGRLQQLMAERQVSQESLATLERERGGLGSRLQQAQSELAAATAAAEEASREKQQIAREKDVLWRELNAREAKSKSEVENEHTARLHAEALRLRAQLEASEREREALLTKALNATKLQATLHAQAQQHEQYAQQQHHQAAVNAYQTRAAALRQGIGIGMHASPLQSPDWITRSESRYKVSFPID